MIEETRENASDQVVVLDLNLIGREDGVNFLNQLQSGAGNKTNAIVQTRLKLVVWKDIENGPRMIWDGGDQHGF